MERLTTSKRTPAPADHFRIGMMKAVVFALAFLAAALRIPMLIMQGGRDNRVPQGQLGLWKKALAGHKNVTFELFPFLNHLFEKGSGAALSEEYLRPGHVEGKVISTIASWVKGAEPGN